MLWWILIRFLVNLYRLLLCGILTQCHFLKFNFFDYQLFAILYYFYIFFVFFRFLFVQTIIIQVLNLLYCIAIVSNDITGTLPDYLFVYSQEPGALHSQDSRPLQRTNDLIALSLDLLVSFLQKRRMGASELRGF